MSTEIINQSSPQDTKAPRPLDPKNQPWGFFATLIFWILLVLAVHIPQSALVTILYFAKPEIFANIELKEFVSNGFFLSLATIIQLPLIAFFSILFIKLKRGLSLKQYLALNKVRIKTVLFWLIFIFVFVVLLSMGMLSLGLRHALDWLHQVWSTAEYPFLLLFSVIFVAPLNEEIIYRGVLFKGFLKTRLGVVGTILLTSALWAAVHFQYGFADLCVIFLGGLVLGMARYKTKSLYTPLLMHIVWNITVVGIYFIIS